MKTNAAETEEESTLQDSSYLADSYHPVTCLIKTNEIYD